jgi:hypothetical protein
MSVKPGQTLGQYRIIEQIGRGGMATVYRAVQPSLSRQVAIKVLPEFFTDDAQFHDRFKQEAMAVASLRHSNILTVFDSGEADGIAYLVTELVDGGTLAARLGKPLPIDECLRIAGAVASALDYAHGRGIVHRDVKPGNVLLTKDGTPILSDFGLVHMMATPTQETITRLTVAGTTIGTPEYMAPEQITNSDVGPAADVYALAVTVYEMLTGAVPYHADTPLNVILARMNTPLPRPRDRNPEIPEAVEVALLKGLATDPADRYRTAGELVQAIHAAQSASLVTPSASAIAPGLAPATAPTGTNRTLVIGALAAVAIVGAGLALVFRLGRDSPRLAQPPSPATATASVPAPTPGPVAPAGGAAASLPPPRPKPGDAAVETKPPAAAPAGASAGATQPRVTGAADGLPPHGRLLYSTASSAEPLVAAPQQPSPDNTITAAASGFDFSAAPQSGVSTLLPVLGLRDFVAVMRFVTTGTRAWMSLRFHMATPGTGHVVTIPTNLRLTPTAGSRLGPPPTCCQPFDVFAGPLTQHPPSLLDGPEPMGVPVAGAEEIVTIAVAGAHIVVYADGQEIGRASDASFGPGAMLLSVATDRQETRLHLSNFEIYAPLGPPPTPTTLPAHGPLLVSLERSLSVLAAVNPGCAGCAIEAKGSALEITATNTVASLPLPVTGIGDFLARFTIAAVSKRPLLMFKFHKPATGPQAQVVQLPAFLRLLPPDPGGSSDPHLCCHDFDIYTAPITASGPALLLGNTTSVAAPAGEPQTFVVTSRGPLIVVYADGKEIARATDANFAPGGMFLQVQARGKDQVPAVLRLSQFEIFAAK